MFRNLKIGLRLHIGFAIILLLLIGVGLIGIDRMKFLSNITHNMHDHPLTVSNAVLRVDVNIIKIHRAMKDVTLSTGQADFNEAVRTVDNLENEVYKDFEIIKERFLGDKRMHEKALELFTAWKPIRDEVISLMNSNKRNEAAAITKGKGAKHVEKLEKSMSVLSDFAYNKAHTFLADTDLKKKNTFLIIYTIVFLASLIVVILSVLLTKSITHPLKSLIHAANEVGKGKLDTKIPVDAADEIGMLSAGFNRMTEDLMANHQEIESNHSELESRVKERTRELEDALFFKDTILEESLIGIAIYDESGQCTALNESFAKMVGASKKQVLDQNYNTIASWKISGMYDQVKRALQTDSKLRFEFSSTTTFGKQADLLCYFSPVLWQKQQYLMLMIDDISELKNLEKEIRSSEEKYRTLAENLPDYIFRYDNELRHLYASPNVVSLSGREADDYTGKTHAELGYDEKESSFWGLKIREVFDTGEMREEKFYYQSSDRLRFLNRRLLPEFNDKGSVKSVIGITRDLTDWKEMEERLERELSFQSAVAEVSESLLNPDINIDEIANLVHKRALTLTDSNHGYAAICDLENGDIVCLTMTNMMGRECLISEEEQKIRFPKIDGKYPGLWGHSLNAEKGFYTNSPDDHEAYKRCAPKGHIKIERFLSAPAMSGKKLIGQIALANSSEDYTDKDLHRIEHLASVFAVAIDRKRMEEEIKESLKEKESLLQEIHHRVKNNMQIISAMLELQLENINDENDRALFTDSQNRINAMAAIHEKLYESDNFAMIDFSEYICDIVFHLYAIYGVTPSVIECKVDVESVYLPIDKAIPCALILNELISNSLKHAFPEKREGKIGVNFHKDDRDRYVLSVKDNGVGIPEGVDFGASETLGLTLIKTLTDQLDGSIELNRSNGAEFTILFRE